MNIIGQLTDQEFINSYPHASISQYDGKRKAVTRYGKSTVNYWVQHEDNSWTNYDCKTK